MDSTKAKTSSNTRPSVSSHRPNGIKQLLSLGSYGPKSQLSRGNIKLGPRQWKRKTPPLTWVSPGRFSCAALCTAWRPIRLGSVYLEGGIYATPVFKAGLLIRSVHLLSSFSSSSSSVPLAWFTEATLDDETRIRDSVYVRSSGSRWALHLWLRLWSNRFRADCLRSVPIARNAACTIALGTPLIHALHEHTSLLIAVSDVFAWWNVFASDIIAIR